MKKSQLPVIAVEIAGNRKTGPVSATYAPLTTCPDSCPFKSAGCYAKNGPAGIATNRCTHNAVKYDLSPLALACIEASAVQDLSGRQPLRLHVSGDFDDALCAEILDNAAGIYTAKHGQPVWAYTHNWEKIPRDVFQNISILASCETVEQAQRASAAGYAVAIVVPEDTKPEGVTICPAITKNAQCSCCRLCMQSDKLKKMIGFYPHGGQKKSVEKIIAQ